MKQDFIFDPGVATSALFSDDRKYRYWLYREWHSGKQTVMLIGLNPSTANENTNDRTIEAIIRLLKKNGYGSFYMTNLFAWITPYPEELKACDDPLGDNDWHLYDIAKQCSEIIYCWGAFDVGGRDAEIIKMFPSGKCFGKNSDGSPKHPLYLKTGTTIINF